MFLDITAEDLGGASIHSQKSGVAQFRCETEQNCYEQVRKLLDYIPHYYGDEIVQAFLRVIALGKPAAEVHALPKTELF